ncbi:hypothetical protein HOG98_00440 [bacterium]|nr:hypothetical protein [bacterium]
MTYSDFKIPIQKKVLLDTILKVYVTLDLSSETTSNETTQTQNNSDQNLPSEK